MPETIAEIKEQLEERVGDEVELIAHTGRKKTKAAKGILSETFPAIFVIELDQTEKRYERASFSYADVLTNTVQVTFSDDGFEVGVSDVEQEDE